MTRVAAGTWSRRTVARQALQWRRCGRISTMAALDAVPPARAAIVVTYCSHASPDSIAAKTFMKRLRPSVIERLTFV